MDVFLAEAALKSLLAVRRGRRDSCVSVEQLYEKCDVASGGLLPGYGRPHLAH